MLDCEIERRLVHNNFETVNIYVVLRQFVLDNLDYVFDFELFVGVETDDFLQTDLHFSV